jgi:hypothetical protein
MGYHLAQLNIARMKYSYESPEMEYFVQRLDPVNELADACKGFVWRLQTDAGNATDFHLYGDPQWLVNMSLWESLDDLEVFFRSDIHLDVMRRKREWFETLDEASFVFWWVPIGHIPDLDEAEARLQHLRKHGSTEQAFTFRQPFTAPE